VAKGKTITERLAEELARNSDLSVSNPTPAIPDPTATPTGVLPSVKAIKQILDVREGRAGSVMDKNLTLRDLYEAGSLSITVGGQTVGSGDGGGLGFGGGGGGSGGGGGGVILLTIPAPTNLAAQGGFSDVLITWDQVSFTNFSFHEVWRGPTSSFSSASKIGEDTATIYVDRSAVMGVTYYYWVRTIGYDPTTGAPINGSFAGSVSGGLLLIGNQNLGPLVVEAEQLSQGTYAGVNLCPNPGSEDGLQCWKIVHNSGAGYAIAVDTSVFYGGSSSFRLDRGTGGVEIGCQAIPVIPGETYAISFTAKGSSSGPAGFWVEVFESTTKPSSGYVDFATKTSVTTVVNNISIGTSWHSQEFTYQAPAGIFWVTLCFANWTGSTTPHVYVDDIVFGRQITAVSLAAQCIAVGTAAIENGAIVNAMIANATIDNAKISDLSASKITSGSIAVGEIIQSANYVAGSVGWLIDASGNAHFNNASINGTINASAGTIGGAVINATNVSSSGYVAGSSGWRLDNSLGEIFAEAIKIQNSTATRVFNTEATSTQPVLQIDSAITILANGTATYAGDLNASGGTFNGNLSAAGGTFSGTLTAAAINAVNTINLAGQAVTIPVNAYTPGSNSFSNGGTLQSATITSSGAPIAITGGANMSCSYVNSTVNNDTITFTCTLSGPSLSSVTLTQRFDAPPGTDSLEYFFTFPIVQATPGAGSRTYIVTGSITSTGVATVSARTTNTRTVFLLETKR
jgi:hypothetical protein